MPPTSRPSSKAIGGATLTHILITHTHRDHTDGLPALLAATGAKTCGFGRRARERGSKRTSPSGSEFVDQDFMPDVPLADGEPLDGDGWAFTALHTPGHAPDHLCFALEGTGILFSGDHVMGWNTSVVAPPEGNMGDYIRSLERLTERSDEVYFPGHGGQVERAAAAGQGLPAAPAHARAGDPGVHPRGHATLSRHRAGRSTAAWIRGSSTRRLFLSLAHVEHLIERGLVRCDAPLSRTPVLSAA